MRKMDVLGIIIITKFKKKKINDNDNQNIKEGCGTSIL